MQWVRVIEPEWVEVVESSIVLPFSEHGWRLGGLIEFGFESDDASESLFDDLVLVPQSFPGSLLELLDVVVLRLECGAMPGEVFVDQVNELLCEDEEVGGGVRVFQHRLNQGLG